jgi:leucyl aminopeptidase (aminopeptidase T)
MKIQELALTQRIFEIEQNMFSRYEGMVKKVISETLHVRPRDNVIVQTWDHGMPIASDFIYHLREVGAHTMLLFEHEERFWRCSEDLPDDTLGKADDHEWAAVEKAKHYAFIPRPADSLRALRNCAKFGASVGYNEEWYERARR